jgi:hypothetical protein
LFNVLAMVAEFESETRSDCVLENGRNCKAKVWLRGPKLRPNQANHLLEQRSGRLHTLRCPRPTAKPAPRGNRSRVIIATIR